MNGRLYDPLLRRFLAPDNFVQDPYNTQHFNRYGYVLNNPLLYTDPSGEFIHLIIGAVVGGIINWALNGAEFSAKGLLYFGVGALAGAIGAGVGAGVSSAIAGGSFGAGFVGSSAALTATSSFFTGAAIGASGGFTSGFGNGLIGGQSLGTALGSGLKTGAFGAVSGGVVGGLWGGIDAAIDGRNFWTGTEGAKVYRIPISDNFGEQNGECALRCFEEFSESYGLDQYDYDYWLQQNGNKLGVHPNKVESIIEGSGSFSSDRIMPDVNSITDAISNDKRVFVGFNTDNGGAHAVMINKVKVWPSGSYKIWFSETSPVRIAPHSISNIFNLKGAGFWTFFPR